MHRLSARLARLEHRRQSRAPAPPDPAEMAATRAKVQAYVAAYETQHPLTEAERVVAVGAGGAVRRPPLAQWSLFERWARALGVTPRELKVRLEPRLEQGASREKLPAAERKRQFSCRATRSRECSSQR